MRVIALAVAWMSLALAGCADDRREERLRAAGPNPSFDALMKVADADMGARKFGQCEGCHKASRDAPDIGGPNLYGVFGQRMGQQRHRRLGFQQGRLVGQHSALWQRDLWFQSCGWPNRDAARVQRAH